MTRVLVQNNTTFAFELHLRAEGVALDTKAGGFDLSPLGSAERRRVLRLNRRGLDGDQCLTISFTLASNSAKPAFELRLQRIGGRRRWCHAWGDQPWAQDREVQTTSRQLADRRIEASCTGIGRFGGDLEVVIRDEIQAQPSAPDTLDLLAYNIWLRPWMQDGQKKRAALLGQCLGGHDVVVLVEAFHRWYTPPLLAALAAEYPYQSQVLGARSAPSPIGPGLKLWNGGVVVVSKWPIEGITTATFRGLLGMTDRMSDKGVLYVCIRKHGRRYHLFATHTQADPENYVRPYYRLRGLDPWDTFRAYRTSNLRVIRQAIEKLDAPENEPVLIVGDLNTDCVNSPAEHARMLDILNAEGCHEARGHQTTYCPRTNEFALGRRAAWLDHILWSRAHLQPTKWDAEIRLIRTATPWRHWGKRHWDLSDHYALGARLTFSRAG